VCSNAPVYEATNPFSEKFKSAQKKKENALLNFAQQRRWLGDSSERRSLGVCKATKVGSGPRISFRLEMSLAELEKSLLENHPIKVPQALRKDFPEAVDVLVLVVNEEELQASLRFLKFTHSVTVQDLTCFYGSLISSTGHFTV
jgi:hypothetical protein